MNRPGIVVALTAEGRTLTPGPLSDNACLPLANGWLLTVSRTGPDAAAEASARLAQAGATALISWGCAAALDPRLQPGDLVLPRQLQAADGAILAVSAGWRDNLHARLAPHLAVAEGAILESRDIVSTVAAKAALFSATGAVALDMESVAVGRVARDRGLPFVAVRSIVDPQHFSLPPALQTAFDADGNLILPRLLSGLCKHPKQLPAVIRLALHFRAAMQTLRKVKTMAGDVLGIPH